MFQQFDTIPSDAPMTAKPRAPIVTAPRRRRPISKIVGLSIVAFSLVTIGYEVTRHIDSLALGILAADFAFLAIAAGWAAVSDRR